MGTKSTAYDSKDISQNKNTLSPLVYLSRKIRKSEEISRNSSDVIVHVKDGKALTAKGAELLAFTLCKRDGRIIDAKA